MTREQGGRSPARLPTRSLTHLEPLEGGERLLVDVLDLVVGQVQPLDGGGLLEDGLAEAADAVAGQPEAVEGVEAGERRGVHLRDLVLAQVEGAQRRAEVAQRGVRDVAEEVGVQAQVLQDGAAVLEDVPERKRWSDESRFRACLPAECPREGRR